MSFHSKMRKCAKGQSTLFLCSNLRNPISDIASQHRFLTGRKMEIVHIPLFLTMNKQSEKEIKS